VNLILNRIVESGKLMPERFGSFHEKDNFPLLEFDKPKFAAPKVRILGP
jgi:hypothetical protein